MSKPSKQSSRKSLPQLSIEEELAEILADPTLQPTINFLKIPASRGTGTESVAGLLPVAVSPLYGNPAHLDIKDTVLSASSPQTSHPIETTPESVRDVAPVPESASVSATGPVQVSRRTPFSLVPDTDSDPVPIYPGPYINDDLSRRPRYQRPRPRRARSVEDGHSHAEHSLYSALWERAQSFNEEARVLTMGFGSMSHIARLSLNNCRQNIRSLIHKLAVEEIRAELSNEKIGKTYLIYAPEAVVRRRKSAGLEWVIRTKGVVFVDPASGAVLTDRSPVPRSSTDTDIESVSAAGPRSATQP